MTTAFIIPAKSRSRRLLNKNFLTLGKYSMIRRAINRSYASGIVGTIYVSSDISLPAYYSAHSYVWSHRPKELAQDDTRVWEVCLYVAKKYYIDTIIMTLPTSPFCRPIDIKNAYQLFLDNDRFPVMSVSKVGFNALTLSQKIKITKEDQLHPFLEDFRWSMGLDPQRNDCFLSNGAVWIVDTEMLEEKKEQYIDGMIGYEMEMPYSLDINTEYDLMLAEKMIEKGIVE